MPQAKLLGPLPDVSQKRRTSSGLPRGTSTYAKAYQRKYDEVAARFAKSDKPQTVEMVVLALCTDNVSRVRLRVSFRVAGNHNSRPMYIVNEEYLDGWACERVLTANHTASTEEWKYMGDSVVPSRTREVVDFGRLDAAVQGMVTLMARIRESGKPPSDDQMNSIVSSRQAIKTWQARAHAELETADSQIALMETVFAHVVGDQMGVQA